MTWGKVAPPEALVTLSEVVSNADGPLPPARVLPLLRDLADQVGDGPADAFGFGTVAYHALTGSDPFTGGGEQARPVTEALPGFPEAAADRLMQALSPDRSARPSPASVVAALDGAWPEYDEPAVPAVDEDTDEPTDRTDEDTAEQDPQNRAEFHQALRDLVAPPRPVPKLGPLNPEGAIPEPAFDPDRPNRLGRRRRSSSRRRRPSAGR